MRCELLLFVATLIATSACERTGIVEDLRDGSVSGASGAAASGAGAGGESGTSGVAGTRADGGTGGVAGMAGEAGAGGLGGSAGDACPDDPDKTVPGVCGCGVSELRFDDLEEDASNWSVFAEGSPTFDLPENVDVPATDGRALRCSLTGGDPYGNVHCYRNLAAIPNAGRIRLEMDFRYEPPSTFNNDGGPSIVQALELTVSKWHLGRRYELARQWQNVGAAAPQFRRWDPHRPLAERWVPVGANGTISGNSWHSIVLQGEIAHDQIRDRGFAVDSTEHPSDVTLAPACEAGTPDKLAVAVQIDGNSTASPYDLYIDRVNLVVCGSDIAHHAQAPDPGFVLDRCGEGTRLDGMTDSDGCGDADFHCYQGPGSTIALANSPGCVDDGLALHYDFAASSEDNWVSIRKEFTPVDLTGYDYLLLPFRGTAGALPRTVEFKLDDVNGCMTSVLFTAASDLPVFRTAVVSLRQFSRVDYSSCGAGFATDLSQIRAVEVGISEIGSDVADTAASGTVYVDDITVVTADPLRRAVDHYECAPRSDAVMGRIAGSLLARQSIHGFVPTWYEEDGYHIYGQALALIVFSLEYARTGNSAFADAAALLADRLVALQSSGMWVNSYRENGGLLEPATAEYWVGNVAWATIGLRVFLREVPTAPAAYEASIAAAASWLKDRIADHEQATGLIGGITSGTEGNVSTYFALVAAGEAAPADAIATFLLDHAWDAREERLRMGIGDWGLAVDVVGNWGAQFLRHRGRDDLARLGLGLAAGVFPVRSWDDSVVGLGDIAGPWQPTVEFTAQYAAAGGPGADWLMEQLLVLEDPNEPGAFPGAPNDFAGGDGWNTAWTGVPPSAWVYLALYGGFLQRL